jgi:hypothetical protein
MTDETTARLIEDPDFDFWLQKLFDGPVLILVLPRRTP